MFQLGVAVQATTLTGVVLQDTEPAVTDRDKVWIRTSAGAPVFPSVWLYYAGLGLWLAKHPMAAGTLWAYPYTGTVASIATLDGGTNVAVTDLTGPFWEVVTTLNARMPIGAGTLPSGTVLNVGDTGGEETHVLLEKELPTLHLYPNPFAGDQFPAAGGAISGGGVDEAQIKPFPTQTDIGEDTAHNNMPPYTVLSFLKRTARVWCTSPIA